MANSAPSQNGPERLDSAWHALRADAALAELAADAQRGLSATEAAQRLLAQGPNVLAERPGRGLLRLFADQFRDFMIVVLIVAGIVAGIIGEPQDTIAIVVIVALNGVIGFVQELRAERAVAALKRLAAAHALVVRDGARTTVAAADLVRGDMVLLEAGNVVPADVRLIEAAQLKVDESALTGESATVDKRADAVLPTATAVADRTNMAYKGTVVTYGRATAVVAATGMTTELGKIAALLGGNEGMKTPLQQRLADLGKRLALAVIGICSVVFLVGLMRGEPVMLILLTAVSLAVAAIPEALPAVVTVLLALGAHKMVRQNALIRRLPAVETLGSVTVICSDKTGTLTQNRMQVQVLHAAGESLRVWADRWTDACAREPWASLLQAMALNNDASAGAAPGLIVGDPTEVALYRAAAAAGFSKRDCEARLPRVMELPFDSERKRMTTFHREGERFVAYTKGAPERVIARCDTMLGEHSAQPLDQVAALNAAELLAQAGLRVLAVAMRVWSALPREPDADRIETDLLFIGLVGMEDPPRKEALEAVRRCQHAGIRPVMITGDHATTARAIAQGLEILAPGARLLTGAELAALDDEAFADSVDHVRVYARVDPAQKIRIVEALQKRGEFVAMTGDGVNDAPALKRADIGVAMGKAGTDVAREASSLVLLDDNFATIGGISQSCVLS